METRLMERKKGVSIFVKLFVAFHVFSITFWALPDPRPPILNGSVEPYGTDWILFYNYEYLKMNPYLRFYLVSGGTWQSWNMFAPNPASTDLWGDAEVVFKDGTVKRYPYYRIYSLPIPIKYFKERFRKFFERASDSRFMFSFAPFAQRVAMEMDSMPDNPPARVRLYKYTEDLKGPGKPREPYKSTMYYDHPVDLPALRRAQGRL
jgi:hypothetical protein